MLIKSITPGDSQGEYTVSVSSSDSSHSYSRRLVFLDVERYDSEATALYVNLTAAEALDLAEALTGAVRVALNTEQK